MEWKIGDRVRVRAETSSVGFQEHGAIGEIIDVMGIAGDIYRLRFENGFDSWFNRVWLEDIGILDHLAEIK